MSLSSRIITRLTVTTLIALAIGYGWLYLKQAHVESYLRQRALVRQAEEISHFLVINADGSIELDLPAPLSESYNSPASRYQYAVRDASGRIILSSGRRVGPVPDFIRTDQHRAYEYRDADRSRTVGGAFRAVLGGRTFVTQVEETAPMVRSINAAVFNEFFTDGGWLGIPFLLALLGVSVWTVRKSFAPLHELSVLAMRIDPGNSQLRLPQGAVPDEILPLVGAVNSALDRLDDGLRKQREFNANAAHQLRTPLAVLAANIDTMSDAATAAKLRYDVDLMSRIVTQLLLVAKLETLNVPLDEQVDLRQVAHDVAENLGPLAVSTGKTMEIEEPAAPVMIRGNRFAVTVALGNLIENALSHTPAGGLVRITVTSAPAIEVRDSGPGIPADMREKIFERFWKGENSKEGAGLGLSIVRRVMTALDGSVAISDAPEGGALFTLSFSAAVPAGRAAAA
jgi:signal transduction histidine kinase